jgi:hypothetical protein
LPTTTVIVPPVDEMRRLARDALADLATDSYEFGKRLRELTGKIFVYPHRLCDGGRAVLRATVRLQLAQLMPDPRLRSVFGQSLERTLSVDLFREPQRVQYRAGVMIRRVRQESERQVARALEIKQATVQRAAALDRLMRRLALSDPYVRLREPPADDAKLRRHLHPRYLFAPLPGHDAG